ncbi:hypothetical protein HN670_02215 [bacterium]|nr:hypothetical protein [Candidatus Komeilibacteria bacterium]MBT7553259.1 hypothetical protein [bacterium]
MSINDLIRKKIPTGRDLKSLGPGSFKKKLYEATKRGALKNLADNEDIINKIVTKRKKDIRTGRYTRDKRRADFREALKDKSLTKDDKRDLKAILKHWSKGEVAEVAKSPAIPKPKKARLRPALSRELPEFLQKRRASVSIAGTSKSDSSRPGSGGGISSGLGGGSTISNPSKPSSRFTKPPRLLK